MSGISHWWEGAYHLTSVYYECDGKTVYLPFSSTTNTEQFFTNLTGLGNGEHTLTVHVSGAGLYYTNYPSQDKTSYSVESAQTVTFIVDKGIKNTPPPTPGTTPAIGPTPSPNSTKPTASLTPSLVPSPSSLASTNPSQQAANDYSYTILLISVVVGGIVVMSIIWMIYFRKFDKSK